MSRGRRLRARVELRCDNVTFRYGRRTVLDDVTVSFPAGVTGLLGPNGAGKSTLLGVLATLLRPDMGQVTLDSRSLHGIDQTSIRRTIGFLPQRFDLMRWSTVERNVAYAAWAQGVPRDRCVASARAALEVVDLSEHSDQRVVSLSGGQRQRVGIACAIAHRPQLVLLDEPTAGLDPAQRVQIRSHLLKVAESSIVVLSTHIVEDLAQMASRVVVLESGSVMFTGEVDEIVAFGCEAPHAGMSALESGYTALLSGHR